MLQKCDEKCTTVNLPSLEFFYEGDLPNGNFQKLTPLIVMKRKLDFYS